MQVFLVLAEGEWCGIVDLAVYGARLARHLLNHHSNGHPAGEPVGVEDNVREHAVRRPGQVLARPLLAGNTLLTRTRGKLVPDRGITGNSEGDADLVL